MCFSLATSNMAACATTWFPGMYIIHFYVIYRNRGRFDLLQIFQVAYNEKGTTYNYVRKLMALPFLPEGQIIPVFDTLKEQATTHMQPLVQYVEDTWILSTVFKPSNWCVFMQSIRTNNDLEG